MKVLIAVDDTDDSTRAAVAARGLFGDEASYVVVNVGQPQLPFWGGDPLMWGVAYPLMIPSGSTGDEPPFVTAPADAEQRAPEHPSVADVALLSAQDVAEAADLGDATAVGASGDPSSRIRALAASEGADVIVVGNHDRGWLARLIAPSVSKDLLRESDRPVLVVP